MGIQDSATLEALACMEALALARVLSIARVIIASDCKEVMNDINSGLGGGSYGSVIREITLTMRSSNHVLSSLRDRRQTSKPIAWLISL